MEYVSLEWAAWMVGTFSLYWLTPSRWRQSVLIALSLIFMASISPISAAILCVFAAITWLTVRSEAPSGKLVAAVTIAFVAVLATFKLQARGQSIEAIISHGLIPLGLSYYTFRCLHLIFERYLGRFREVRLSEVIGYLFFLPTIVVGPIHRFGDYQRDLYRVRLESGNLWRGLERILYGYVKIGWFGDHLINGLLGNYVSKLPPENASLAAYLWIIQGGLNLYFQFSGYADIAIGFSRLLGFRVIENFNWPYLQRNLSDFWRSWHISLTSWCRDYIYTSVVSRSRSPALGAMATLLAVGLWHEISLRFVCWGLFHGFGLVVWQRFQSAKPHLPQVKSRVLRLAWRIFSTVFTAHYVWFGFAIVRKHSLQDVLHVWSAATIGFLR